MEVVTNMKKMKEKVVEGSDNESSNEESLKQRHSSNARTFSCRFCKKEFSTFQALGGHQSAHKKERALAKRRNGLVDVVSPLGPPNYHPYYHLYSNFNSHLPFYGSLQNSLNFENKTSGKGLNLMDDNMKIGLGGEEKEKNNEEEELDLDLKL
ncbi:hypothetical protein HAX54_020370 [Datura stramonium]|uniref:C2H2-type domain-containing protein n=1 Tax=Datura stramonium TaxID=4076 RepID=A0ABS8UR26_DATST|nr:hypothetical protein [Datura stramonium]